MIRGALIAIVSLVLTAPWALALQPPEPQNEFRPLSELPPSEQIPGGVFLVIAYAFIWVAAVIYLWSIWRRLGKVEAEMRSLEQRANRSGAR